MFLHEYRNIRKEVIKHDVKWLDKNLNVEVVQSVQLRRSLRGHHQTHTEKRAAMALKTATGHTIYIAADQGRKPDMYQVGQAVCTMVLSRHNQQAYFFFEPFLKLDLLDLRARGYNVDRILRAKQEEARIAEEERRRALEAEEQKIKERQAEWARQTTAVPEAEKKRPSTPPKLPGAMPGAFDDSPEPTPAQPPPPTIPKDRRSKGFLSNFTRRLGLERDQDAEDQLDKLLTTPEPEPTPEAKPPQPQSGPPKPPGPGDNGRVTSPAVVQNNLLQAIRSTRPHNSSSVFTPPQTQEVKETSTYCDSKPAQNIVSVGNAPNQMKVYLHKDLVASMPDFMATNIGAISKFETLLRDVVEVYGVSSTAIQIHYDAQGPCIAFNTNGSIFCNLRFFLQLHYEKMTSQGRAAAEARAEATIWWFVVVAHELAHNLVSAHDANHSYYTESFVQEYFTKMMTKAASWMQAAPEINLNNNSSNNLIDTSIPMGQERPLPPPPPYS